MFPRILNALYVLSLFLPEHPPVMLITLPKYLKDRLCGLIVRVRVVPRRTVVGDIDRRFENLSGIAEVIRKSIPLSGELAFLSGQGCFLL